MDAWLVEARLQSRLGIGREQLDRIRRATAGLRPRVVRHRHLHAALHLVVDAPSEVEAARAVDAALAVALDAFWEVAWETDVVTRLG